MDVTDQGRIAAGKAYRKLQRQRQSIEEAMDLLRQVDLEQTRYTHHIPEVRGMLKVLYVINESVVTRLADMAGSDDWMGVPPKTKKHPVSHHEGD